MSERDATRRESRRREKGRERETPACDSKLIINARRKGCRAYIYRSFLTHIERERGREERGRERKKDETIGYTCISSLQSQSIPLRLLAYRISNRCRPRAPNFRYSALRGFLRRAFSSGCCHEYRLCPDMEYARSGQHGTSCSPSVVSSRGKQIEGDCQLSRDARRELTQRARIWAIRKRNYEHAVIESCGA